jgi:hypothetical protein
MQAEKTTIICHSNDRPNIHFVVEKMQYSTKSMQDLEQILQLVLQLDGTTPPPAFMGMRLRS